MAFSFKQAATILVLAAMFFAIAVTGLSLAQDKKTVGENLLSNASFESVDGNLPTGWGTNTWSGEPVFELESSFAHSGKYCLKIHSERGADASWSFETDVKPQKEYRLSAWVKTENVKGGNGALLNLHQLQHEGKSLPLVGTQDWTQITTTFRSGPRSKLLVNCLLGGWGKATGTAWFDDLELVELRDDIEVPEMSEAEAADFFEAKVLPVLRESCFQCHGAEKIRAELVMTNREDLLNGGESGPAIDLDSPMDSLLLEAINYEGYEMPPSGKLPAEDIKNITTWIQLGAPWKGDGYKPHAEPAENAPPEVNEETKQWWSYQKRKPVTPPKNLESDWISNEVDQFVLGRLQSAGLTPNPRASKQTLIRRAYYDLTGLPPTPGEVAEFVANTDPAAYEKLIDKLLASRHYGEKWGRHWLDLVRYAESNSYERDGTKPFVWRYRDYVIQSFNNDKPYDQFVIEQLAGDELEDQTHESLIATGYYRLGRWDDEPVDPEQAWYDDMDDILKTTSQAMLGMTVDCARCHDHKIDPIPQADYYRMLSFFRNVQRYGVRSHDTVLRQSSRPIVDKAVVEKHSEEVALHKKRVRENREALGEIEKLVKQDFIDVEHEEFAHEMNRVPLVKKRAGKTIKGMTFSVKAAEKYEVLFNEMKRLRRNPPRALEACLCVTEKGATAAETYVLIRGNAAAKSDLVEPGFPSVLSPPEPEIATPTDQESTGRRLALAKWIGSPGNPLTARVMVNRIWQHHFGRGIVKSANDFGFQGNQPTHPQLLDWLANEFVEGGWRIKRMHKLLMMSQTYQMSSESRPEALAADPVNDLFWRFNMRRLTAEEVRDSILSVNQSINLDDFLGPSIYPVIPDEVLQGQSRPGENWGNSSKRELGRRSIYIHIKRSLPVPMMASFDVADPDTSCPVRFNTVQPTQALGMLNSEFINQEAVKFSKSVLKAGAATVSEKIKTALERVLQREPNRQEVEYGSSFVEKMKSMGHDDQKAFELYCVVALNLNEFLFLD